MPGRVPDDSRGAIPHTTCDIVCRVQRAANEKKSLRFCPIKSQVPYAGTPALNPQSPLQRDCNDMFIIDDMTLGAMVDDAADERVVKAQASADHRAFVIAIAHMEAFRDTLREPNGSLLHNGEADGRRNRALYDAAYAAAQANPAYRAWAIKRICALIAW